jgi:nucleotide-binding universal stress UspA family protein
MFKTVLHANDGSEPAFRALTLAIDIAKQNAAAEIRGAKGTAARRFHTVAERARHLAKAAGLDLHVHVLSGHPVRMIVDLAASIGADLLVIGATGHSALYERLIGSRADRIVQLSACPVLVVK